LIYNDLKKLNRNDLPVANDLLKNELDPKISNITKNTFVPLNDNHANSNLYQSVKDADDIIFLSNESN